MDITFAAGDAWAGATKGMNADWSAGNALEFYTIPEQYGQKVVVQVTAGGNTIFDPFWRIRPAWGEYMCFAFLNLREIPSPVSLKENNI